LIVGYAGWFASFWGRWDHWSHQNPELGEFIEPTSGLAAKGSGDSELVIRGFTGYSIDETWAASTAPRAGK
jgi:hypothetical protein